MLKRIGLGMALMIVCLATSLAMDVVVHLKEDDTNCMFSGYAKNSNKSQMLIDWILPPTLYQNSYFLAVQHFLSALVNMLIDIAVFEFICSQSPYSMKGLLLGLFLSIKSLSQGIAIMSIVPFGLAWHEKHLSCGSGFYLMNIVIGVLELTLFTLVAKKYKYRIINEPSNEYRYAEEYYSNIQ